MIQLPADEADSEAFLARIESMAHGICRLHKPKELIVVQIDNWFGPKWLRFSGKYMGAAGISLYRLTMPPFTPNRVVWQRRYRPDGTGAYKEVDPGAMLHVKQTTTDNFKRLPRDIAPETALLWFSGRTKDSGRGAVMAYIPAEEGYLTWYAGFVEKGVWQVQSLKGLSRRELESLDRHDNANTIKP